MGALSANWHRDKAGSRFLRFHAMRTFVWVSLSHISNALGSLAVVALLALATPAGGGVFVPGFWAPHHRPAKPDLTGLRSLRFLTEDDYPPFHFALPDATLSGFDVDLA